MAQDKEKTLKIYQVPMLQITIFSGDVLMLAASQEPNDEFPDNWN